ncbi:MAG: glycosyltransferase family 2 protein [Desulfobacterales bacterium]|nr:glycosyltransferase family 2 protein [Desulfobacterales bacterium]
MIKDPLISVLIPLFNHQKYIIQCLESILKDSYANKEIIIIDDASSDKSSTIVDDWIKINNHIITVKFHKSPYNKGLCSTLNDLIDMSSGQYLVMLASDDYLLKDGIQKRLDFLKTNPDKCAVIGDCIVVDEQGKTIYSSGLFDLRKANYKNYFNDYGLKKEILHNFAIPGPVLMVKKTFYEEIGKYDESLLCEDWQFYVKTIALNKLGFIDFKVSAYRWDNNNSCLNRSLYIKRIMGVCFTILENYHRFRKNDKLRLLYIFFRTSIHAVRFTINQPKQ